MGSKRVILPPDAKPGAEPGHRLCVETNQPKEEFGIGLKSLKDLLGRDKVREEDGFPRKIRIGRLVRPGRGGKEQFVIVPGVVEEKLVHDRNWPPEDEEEQPVGGSGEGDEGEVIGEQRIPQEGEGEDQGAGGGEGEAHELESSAYDLGKILVEQFQLPNLKDKGRRNVLVRYSHDLTDRNRGFGQLLDKKATMRRILETNLALGNVPDVENIDTSSFIVSPADRVYRTLSPEPDYESQAVVFFVRDYSGSMEGKATELVCTQHVLIYSWLLYQYARQVETRFILHDIEAKETDDFHTYFRSRVAGGTKVGAAYRLVNRIVREENLDRDYNIYLFHGTDGDDWDTEGKEALPELAEMLTYCSRIGITVVRHAYGTMIRSDVEGYLHQSGLLKEKADLLRLDVFGEEAEEGRLIEGIRKLVE